ncbi:unnamed protein product [Closterium sp. NIES-54]
MLERAVQLATSSAGLTAPHPFAGCVLRRDARVVAETWLHAQGTASAEKQAVEAAGEAARGATVYLNLEPGDCHGDDTAVHALIQAGVARVVVGLLNPLPHHHGRAVAMLRQAGVTVDVLGEGDLAHPDMDDVVRNCRAVNEALLFRAHTGLPFSILKYAMTLDVTPPTTPGPPPVISFYKSWDPFGALSNFSPHPIRLPLVLPLSLPSSSSSPPSTSAASNGGGEEGEEVLWHTVEHFYQAQKFSCSPCEYEAARAVREIRAAETPEEAARIGRALERKRPDLLRPNWQEEKLAVMRAALRKKFTTYPQLKELLLSTGDSPLVEASTHDFFWGSGWTRRGKNNLGVLLMRLRNELLVESRGE